MRQEIRDHGCGLKGALRLIGLLGLALVLTGFFPGEAHGALTAYYYNIGGGPNYDFGSFIRSEVVNEVNFGWGDPGSPSGVPVDNFGVSWRGEVNIPSEGTWTFRTNTDDGARVYIDGQRIIDDWIPSGPDSVSGSKYLTAGKHHLVFDYFEAGGGANASLYYTGPGVGDQIIPNGATNVELTTPAGLLSRWYPVSDCAGSWGALAGTRVDANVAYQPGFAPPFGLSDEFVGARWVGRLNIPTTGWWRFYGWTDDAVRFYIDSNGDGNLEKIIENWGGGGAEYSSGQIFLHGGLHDISLDFFECTGAQYMELRWEGPNQGKSAIPASAFLQHDRGLITELFNDEYATNPVTVYRNDSVVYFPSWAGSPQDSINADYFSVRWMGKIFIPTTGSYTFYGTSDDGNELYVNGTQIINDYANYHPMQENTSSPVSLTGGQSYYITFRMHEGTSGAGAELRWSGPGIGKQLIPKEYLRPILNEAPTNLSLSNASFLDNAGSNALVGTLSTTDPDNTTGGSQTHTYALVPGTGSGSNGSFTISGSELHVNNAAMARGTYSIRVRTTDNGSTPDKLTYEKILIITCLDRTPPVLVNCPSNFALPANASCGNTVPNFFAGPYNVSGTDGPNPAPTLSQVPVAGTAFGPSPVTVTLTASDGIPENTPATCQVTISVADNTAPTVVCKPYALNLDVKNTVVLADINNGSADNCGFNLDATTIVPNTFNCDDIGVRQVWLTMFDTSGNSSFCDATVTISGSFKNALQSAALVELYTGDAVGSPMQTRADCGTAPYAFAWYFDADGFGTGASEQLLSNGGHVANGGTTVLIGGTSPTTTLGLTNVVPAVAGYYRSRVTDGTPNSVDSGVVTLDVEPATRISLQPTGGHRNTGASYAFSVTAADGYGSYTYAWYKVGNPTPIANDGRISGATSPTLSITNVQPSDSADYYCVVKDRLISGSGSVAQSDPATLLVTDDLTISNPTPATVNTYGTSQTLEVEASGGSGTRTFTWYWDADGFGTGAAEQPVPGPTHPNGTTAVSFENPGGGVNRIVMTNLVVSASGEYRCVVSDTGPDDNATSGVAKLEKRNAVDVTVNPATATRRNYVDSLSLTATATGGFGNLSYRWQLDTGSGFLPLSNGPVTVSRPGYNPANPGVYSVNVTYNVSGANTNVLQIDHPLFGVHDGLFKCIVEDEQYPIQGLPAGTDNAQSDVTMEDQVAIISSIPGGSYYAGNLMEMSAVVIGGTPMQAPTPSTNYSYNWYYSTIPSAIPSIQNSAVSKFSVAARSGTPSGPIAYPGNTGYEGYYRIGATFPLAGGATSDPSTHNLVRDAVHFTTSPANQTKNVTDTVQFDVAAAGGYPAPTGYQYFWTWNTQLLQNGQPHPSGSTSVVSINAATGQLTISGLRVADAGTYEVRANDANAPCAALGNKCTATAQAILTVTNNISVKDDPDDLDLYVGDTANFQVAADGGALPYTYTWYWDFGSGGVRLDNGSHRSGTGSSVSGATTATLTVSSVQLGATPQFSDAGEYYCIVSDGSGVNQADTSARAVLAVYNPVRFTANPASLTRWVGGSAPFAVTVGGGLRGERSLRWQVNPGSGFVDLSDGPTVSGATTVALTVSGLVLTDNGKVYRCVATSPASGDPLSPASNTTHTSGNATLTVANELTIQDQPADVEAYVTDPAFTLTVHFTGGVAPFTAVWKRAGVDPVVAEQVVPGGQVVPGAPSEARLSVSPGSVPLGVHAYAVEITDAVGMKRSGAGTVVVAGALSFSKPLSNAFVRERQRFRWAVEATGGLGQISYQWYKEDGQGKSFVPLTDDALHTGTLSAELTFVEISYDDVGMYLVEVSDDHMTASTQAELSVGNALPVSGAIGLAAAALASALAGARSLRRRR